jgi:FAD/FMN-containing dehydrogenase
MSRDAQENVMMLKSIAPALAAADELRSAMRGKVVLPGDDSSDEARQIWSGAIDDRPALFAVCETRDDVKAAIRIAQARGLRLSVHGGGNGGAGRAMRHDGLVIDLSAMRQVRVNATARTATIAGGARACDVIAASAPYGLAAVTGNCGSAGMVGLTLGGGYGPLSPRFGLASDNLLGAEVILANGRCVTVDALENPDLFWALRGGGGNFGVVTSMRIRLHPVRELLAGLIMFPWSEAETVLRRYAWIAGSAPDDLAMTLGVLSGPDRVPILFMVPVWSGNPEQGKPFMDRLTRLGTPAMVRTGTTTYQDLLEMFDREIADGRRHTLQTRWLPELSNSVISSLIAAGSKRTSRFAMIALQHFHGLPARIPSGASAFGMRQEHFLLQAIVASEPGDGDSHTHHAWARHLSRVLAPTALPGGYANFLGSDNDDELALACGGNAERLQQVKRRFDPGNVFSAISLPPEIDLTATDSDRVVPLRS